MTKPTKLDNRIPPPIVMVAMGIVMGAAQFAGAAMPIPATVRLAGIAAALIVGASFGVSAFIAFGRAKTTINPVDIESASSLVTTGIYGISRNPMYVGLTSLLVVLALALSNGWLLAGPVLFAVFVTLFQILPEERVMAAKFGAEYAAYRRRVRRWL